MDAADGQVVPAERGIPFEAFACDLQGLLEVTEVPIQFRQPGVNLGPCVRGDRLAQLTDFL